MLKVIYEDNQVIVVYKETGILAQADISGASDLLTMTKEYIKEKYNKPGAVYLGLVHRLDRNTSGLMVLQGHLRPQLDYLNKLEHIVLLKISLCM